LARFLAVVGRRSDCLLGDMRMAFCRTNTRCPYCPFWLLKLLWRCWRLERTWDTQPQMAENLETAIIYTVDLPQTFSVQCDPEQNFPKEDVDRITR
jgi:hypothetical protein